MRRRLLVAVAVVAVVLVAALLVATVESRFAALLRPLRVTAQQVAVAMREDRFFSDYNERTLIVDGRVGSLLHRAGRYTAVFATGDRFGARCDLGTSAQGLHPFERATLVSESADAEREPGFVLLAGCVRA